MPPDDLLPPSPDPLPHDSAARRKLICEFCECQLAPNGDAMVLSDRAKGYRDLKDRHETLKADLAKVTSERDAALAKVREHESRSTSIFR